jgi:caffeoyl-CoA O-methyltransferase
MSFDRSCLNDELMNRKKIKICNITFSLLIFSLLEAAILTPLKAQNPKEITTFDVKVKKFLDEKSGQWYDLNIPTVDGQTLYDIIVKHNYKSALEIGTSTGHSGIWIAWALSKTGGKLITIEIDEGRYKTAIENFKKAGVSEYIKAYRMDAHELVKALKGPFDFVFSDADKGWYKNYFIDVDPKLKVGGCFTAHNITERGTGRRGFGSSGQDIFLDYIRSLKNFETTIDSKGGGISISYKKAEK